MLAMRFNSVRDLHYPAVGREADAVILRWAVRVVHGSQRHQTRFISVDDGHAMVSK